MKKLIPVISIFYTFLFFSCSSIRESPKYELTDGIYNSSIITKSEDKVYIEMHEDTIQAFQAIKQNNEYEINRTEEIERFPEIRSEQPLNTYYLYKPSFDIDFITIPLKYRPSVSGFPRTLPSTLSGAVYLGGRYDIFRINYKSTPLQTEERNISHYGFSLGIFSGIGSAFIAPWFTNDAINSEYDGVVFMKGIAFLIAINQFTAGLALGTDNLLDQNDQFWIYEKKPWLGLTFGLNLN